MFLHEIFHQGLKARIANWPTLVLGELLLHRNTNTHGVLSAATQGHQGQIFSASPHPLCLVQTSALTSYVTFHTHEQQLPYLSLQHAHALCRQTMASRTRRHLSFFHLLKQTRITKETDCRQTLRLIFWDKQKKKRFH